MNLQHGYSGVWPFCRWNLLLTPLSETGHELFSLEHCSVHKMKKNTLLCIIISFVVFGFLKWMQCLAEKTHCYCPEAHLQLPAILGHWCTPSPLQLKIKKVIKQVFLLCSCWGVSMPHTSIMCSTSWGSSGFLQKEVCSPWFALKYLFITPARPGYIFFGEAMLLLECYINKEMNWRLCLSYRWLQECPKNKSVLGKERSIFLGVAPPVSYS